MPTKTFTKSETVYFLPLDVEDYKAMLEAERFPKPLQPPLDCRVREISGVTNFYNTGHAVHVTIKIEHDSANTRENIQNIVAAFIEEAYRHNGLKPEYNSMNDFKNAVKKAGLWIDRTNNSVNRGDDIIGTYRYDIRGAGVVTVKLD